MSRKIMTLLCAVLLTALFSIGCDEDPINGANGVDAPASVDGLRYDMTITSSTGALLGEGTFRISFSGTNHQIDGDDPIPDSSGNFVYDASGSVGTIDANDIVWGNPAELILTFTTETSGTFTLTAPGGTQGGGTQAGTFTTP